MPDKKSFAVTLIIIYLALVFLVGTAVYALIVYFCLNDSLATNILIWTATLFATIALLYTFNFWKDQKGSEVLSKLSENVFFKLNRVSDLHNKIYREHGDRLLDKLINNIDLSKDDIETELVKNFKNEMQSILEHIYLIHEYTKDKELLNHAKDLFTSYEKYLATRADIYMGMKVVEQTETSLKAVAIDKNDRNEYLTHIDKHNKESHDFLKSIPNIYSELLKYIFYSDKNHLDKKISNPQSQNKSIQN